MDATFYSFFISSNKCIMQWISTRSNELSSKGFNEILNFSHIILFYFYKNCFMPQIHKTIPLLWTFYKSYCLLSALITFICVRTLWLYGFTSFFAIFWFKIFTLVVTFFFVNQTKKKAYYYYQNLGIGKTLLWTATLSFDCIVFAILLILTNQYS